MRIAIVDDLAGERALLREQLSQQLARRGAEAELLEFDSGEAADWGCGSSAIGRCLSTVI